jgi:hypothetical protein
MASLSKKKVLSRTYYYLAESKRVAGKPRMVKQWYLGPVEKLITYAEGNMDPKSENSLFLPRVS